MSVPLLVLALTVAVTPPSLCALCHPDVRVEFEQSVHRVEGVTCTSCHGGNPNASTVEGAHREGYRGIPRRRDIPSLCASCHADVRMMRPYNLPTDQYALYQTSQHGILLAKGDARVAVCTDCHGVHEIRRRDDPSSSVYFRNIPGTCARCHADAALMRRYGLTGNPYADYAAGVHGKALLEQGNAAAPDCSRCHGAHGASPPGVGDVDKVCGQCHGSTRAYFLEGPHKEAMGAAGYPECASCHEQHRIMKPAVAQLDTICLKCHERGSAEVELATRMKTMFTGAAEEIEKAGGLVEQASGVPLYVEDYRARLQEARTSLLEAMPVMHALDLAHVENLTRRARSIGNEVESEVTGKLDDRRWRRVGLMVFWFYLLLTIAILVRLRRRAAARVSR